MLRPAFKPSVPASTAGVSMEEGPGGDAHGGRQEDDDEYQGEEMEDIDDEATIDQEEALAATEGGDAKVTRRLGLPVSQSHQYNASAQSVFH